MFFILPQSQCFTNVRHIGFTKMIKEWQHFERISDEYIMYFVVEGEMFLKEDHINYHLRVGDFLILEPNKLHVGYKASKCQYYYFHFNKNSNFMSRDFTREELVEKWVKIRKNSLTSNPFLPSEHPQDVDIIFPKYFNISDKSKIIDISNITYTAIVDYYTKYENYRLFVSSVSLQVLIMISREFVTSLFDEENSPLNSSKMLINIHKLSDYISKNYQTKLNKKTIENYMELNYDYLNQLFKKYYSTTIGIYIQNTRINAAKKLIRETDLSFSEVAYLVGINDPYYFSKLFKKFTGISPSRYNELMLIEHQ